MTKQPTLYWKDEGEEGPATLDYSPQAVQVLHEIGTPYPDTIERLGWMTRKQAMKRAKALGVRFGEA